jgi:hypothetical protein
MLPDRWHPVLTVATSPLESLFEIEARLYREARGWRMVRHSLGESEHSWLRSTADDWGIAAPVPHLSWPLRSVLDFVYEAQRDLSVSWHERHRRDIAAQNSVQRAIRRLSEKGLIERVRVSAVCRRWDPLDAQRRNILCARMPPSGVGLNDAQNLREEATLRCRRHLIEGASALMRPRSPAFAREWAATMLSEGYVMPNPEVASATGRWLAWFVSI